MFEDSNFFTPTYVQQGWQCPVCKRVYSPSTFQCFYCGNQEVITSDKVLINTQETNTYPDLNGPYIWTGTVPECNLRSADSWSGTVPEARRKL